ncbi:MAG: phosphatidylinositol-specific phospholipase C domain-containing protein [Treponemataceae bacterium]
MSNCKKGFQILGIILCILVILVLTFITVFFVTPIFSGNSKNYGTYENSYNSSNWMTNLDDSITINKINLPGTHDSASEYVQLAYFARCQTKSIKNQLENGYRYLDIRLGIENLEDGTQKLKLMHGFTNCKTSWQKSAPLLYLDSVLEQCYSFLKDNQSESIVFCVKQEYGSESVTDFQNLLFSYINKNPELWYLENKIPELKDVRGKIILARRFQNEAAIENAGLNLVWIDQPNRDIVPVSYELNMQENGSPLVVQDRFKYDIEDKWTAFLTSVEATDNDNQADAIYINFLSTNGNTKFGHPIKYALPLNERFWKYDFSNVKRNGWVILDFAVEELAQKIYMTNF